MAEILGVRVDENRAGELELKLRSFLAEPKFHKVFTPNAEILLEAHRNGSFKECLNRGDLNIADGVSIVFASWFQTHLNKKSRQTNFSRHTGVDTLELLCKIAAEEGKSVMFFGADPGIAKKAAEVMRNKYPTLSIKGTDPGIVRQTEGKWSFEHGSIEDIRSANPDILAVALGHPKQEQLICSLADELPSVKIAIGVGGALDYISGNVRRAPVWMRRLGLEWLYRLIRQPQRIGRIFNAVILFPLAVIRDRIKSL